MTAQISEPVMTSNYLHRALGLVCAAAIGSAGAQAPLPSPTLTPPAQRITDRAINADQQTYEAMQARLKAINDSGRPVRDYHLSKAQCWLDVSFHEYTRNDRGPFPQDALDQSHQLALGMERGQPQPQNPLGLDTPLISGADRLRPDLWDAAQQLKGHRGFRCAQQKTACAEVELVHAGHEHKQLQWRHAKPYVQIAEDLLAEAWLLAERCDPPAPPAPPAPVAAAAVAAAPAAVAAAPPPPAPPAPAAAPPKPVFLAATVVFDFDRYQAKNLRPESQQELAALVAKVRAENLLVRSLHLVGHADRLNSTGVPRYNQRLSERRAATVRAELARLGLPAAEVSTEAVGNNQQVLACADRYASKAALQACLLPNRRVEVRVEAVAPGR